MFRWIPESLSWLELQGRRGEARAVLAKVARVNGMEFSDVFMEISSSSQQDGGAEQSEQSQQWSFMELCKYKRLKRSAIAITIVWYVGQGVDDSILETGGDWRVVCIKLYSLQHDELRGLLRACSEHLTPG